MSARTPSFAPILARAFKRHGGAKAVEKILPKAKSAGALAKVPDDRYLSLMSLRIFRAGLKHDLVDAKWPAFEKAFRGFVPARVLAMPPEALEACMKDTRLIRHWAKLKSIPANAKAMAGVAREHGSMGAYLAHWPADDVVGLWEDLAKRFQQMGGNSAPYFLRMAGKDTFVLTDFVVRGLVECGACKTPPKGKADRRRVQTVFNEWAVESGRPICQISRLLALSVD